MPVALGVWLLAAVASLVALGAATASGGLWPSRETPARVLRVAIGVAFAAWVDPSLGLLAFVSGGWWLARGWERVAGGTFWPLVAMALWLGGHLSEAEAHAVIALWLAVGVLQVSLACAQWGRWGIGIAPTGVVHGTLGHRTGLGILLAVLMPLGFLSDAGWGFAFVMLAGVALSRSASASLAWWIGLLVVFPAWPVVVGGFGVAWLAAMPRLVVWDRRARRFVWLHLRDTVRARWGVWRLTVVHLARWPAWLVGYGAHAFDEGSRRWTMRDRLSERYREAHNDYVEALYEYGLIGVVAIGWWLWRYGASLQFGDPVTGSLAALGVTMGAHFPLRLPPVAILALFLAAVIMRRQGWPA